MPLPPLALPCTLTAAPRPSLTGRVRSCSTCELQYADVPEGVYMNYYQLSATSVWPAEKDSCNSHDAAVHKKGRLTGT